MRCLVRCLLPFCAVTLVAPAPVVLLGCGDDAGQQAAPGFPTDAGTDSASDAPGVDGGTDALDARENVPPSAVLVAVPPAGPAPLEVEFDATGSLDFDGEIADYAWDFADGSSGSGASVGHTFSDPGCFRVVLTVTDDDGDRDSAETTIVVTNGAPSGDPVVTFDAMPLPMAVLPRDLTTNEGTALVRGVVGSPGYDAVVAEVSQGGSAVATVSRPLCSQAQEDPFELSIPIAAELQSHVISVYLVAGQDRTLVQTVDDVVAGDVLLVQGQSNAVATQNAGDANVNQGPFLRSFGTRNEDPGATAADVAWHLAEGNGATGPGAIGQWSLRMGALLVERQQVPIAILNGARGGRPIDYFQRNDADPVDLATNYGRLLHRVRAAGLQNGIRAMLYYQGESDGANAQPHHDGWVALHQAWLEDYPSLERAYVTQVRPGCGSPTPALQEVQRQFADELPQVSVMSTNGLDGHDGCHFAYVEGYEELGGRYAALLARDLFGGAALPDIEAPNVDRVYFSASDRTEVTIALRDSGSTLTWDAGAEADFIVQGASVAVVSGRTEGAKVILTLSADGAGATGLTYTGHALAGPWVTNATGIGLLAFHAVAIDAGP